MRFEWDAEKAMQNLAKHEVSFAEASMLFDDPLSVTVSDPRHSWSEERLVLFGVSCRGRLLAVFHPDRDRTTRLISARLMTVVSGNNMKPDAEDEEMLPEYDLIGGVRGKYVERYRQGANVILLDPDVAEKFPTSESVNDALRRLAGRGGG